MNLHLSLNSKRYWAINLSNMFTNDVVFESLDFKEQVSGATLELNV